MSEVWPPQHAELLVSFDVAGTPKGAGSKDAIPLGRWYFTDGQRKFRATLRESGVPIVNVVDSAGAEGEAWSQQIRAACLLALDGAHAMHDGPIAVRVTFFTPGPKGRYGTGRNADRLKPTADRLPYRAELSDGTKLARRLEDALNALLWTDDRRVCEMWWSRAFGRGPGARVQVYGLPARFCDLPGDAEQVRSREQLVIMEGDEPVDQADIHAAGARGGVDAPAADWGDGGREPVGDPPVELWA